MRKQMLKEIKMKESQNVDEIKKLQKQFESEHKLLKKIDFRYAIFLEKSKLGIRRRRYIETLKDQLVIAKNVIKNPRVLHKHA